MGFPDKKKRSGAVAVVLAGGQGSRLHELTGRTCKPAVGFAGGRRIIDWTMHNLSKATLDKVLVTTQYKPQELSQHISTFWGPAFGRGTMSLRDGRTVTGQGQGYRGTADAVTQNLTELLKTNAETVLVVAADHIYTMDYDAMLAAHRSSGRPVTVAVDRVSLHEARAFGVMDADRSGAVIAFAEKPQTPKPMHDDPSRALVSMGIYAFDLDWLAKTLMADARNPDSDHDFGHDILPQAVAQHNVGVYDPAASTPNFYWRDVGTIDALRKTCIAIAIGAAGCRVPPYPTGLRAASGTHILPGGSVILPGGGVTSGARLRNVIVGPGAVVPTDLEAGFDADADRRFFRVAEGGTVLITRDMLIRRAAARRHLTPWPTRPAVGTNRLPVHEKLF